VKACISGQAPLTVLAERYFAAVDRMDLSATLACFTPEATFTIATYDTPYLGRDTEIKSMFERLFARYTSVWHGDFAHVVQPPDRIASRFTVRNIDFQQRTLVKNNCNFFRLRGALFAEVFVYMSGDNSLG
jgi:transcriptional regulator of nitric oxide reductase